MNAKLFKVNIHIIDKNICNGPDSYNGIIPITSFCAGSLDGGKDSCLVSYSRSTHIWVKIQFLSLNF